MKGIDLRDAVRTHGPRAMGAILREALEADDKASFRLRPEQVSLRESWEAFVGSTSRTLPSGGAFSMDALHEAEIGVAEFQKTIGALIVKRMIEGYRDRRFIGDELVEPIHEKHRKFTVVGVEDEANPGTVKPGEPYPRKPFGSEIYVTGEQTKKGHIVEVDEDLIMEDQTGQLLSRASDQGFRARIDKEYRIITGVLDVNSVVFTPQGSAEALYRTSAGTNSARVNAHTGALADWTDINEAKALFAAFTDKRDQTGKLLPPPLEMALLTADALTATAHYIANATQIEYDALSSGVGQIHRATNPYAGRLKPMSSNLIDSLGSAATWLVGDFKRQFKWFYKYPMQVIPIYADPRSPAMFNRDVILEVKVREYGEIVAVDDCYVVKSTGAG